MIKAITLITLIMLVSTSLVSAQTMNYNPIILPDSPFYGIKIALENIKMALKKQDYIF